MWWTIVVILVMIILWIELTNVESFVTTNQPVYTARYLSRYWALIVHKLLMKYELVHFKHFTPVISITQHYHRYPRIPIAQNPQVGQLLVWLKQEFPQWPIINPMWYYTLPDGDGDGNGDGNGTLIVPLRKKAGYSVQEWWHFHDVRNFPDEVNLLIRQDNATQAITSVGIQDFPKITQLPGKDWQFSEWATTNIAQEIPTLAETKAEVFEISKKRADDLKWHCFMAHGTATKNNHTSCVVDGGVWDIPCINDSECPYYKANQNYPNSFGGCNKATGYCDMPLGIKKQSHHKVLIGVPYCYNCQKGPGALGACCEQQAKPDYAFKNDQNQRRIYQKSLSSKGLEWWGEGDSGGSSEV